MRKWVNPVVAVLTGVLVLLLGAPAAEAGKKPPFISIKNQYLPLPAGVQPWLPTWTQGGTHILFHDQSQGTQWIVRRDGKNPRCITCGFSDRPTQSAAFVYAFPDNKRIFISHTLGASGGRDSGPDPDAQILECSPSIFNCRDHDFLPIDMSEDKGGGHFIVQRRTWHLAPDGVTLGWMDVRLDGTVVIVGRLERRAHDYVVVGQKVINPTGPTSTSDPDPRAWANDSQLYELKGFAYGGRSAVLVGQPETNVDMLTVDLASGKTNRLTRHPDWDEDGSISPDGSLMISNSWRPRGRLDSISVISEIEPFVTMPLAAALAGYYVSTWPGYQCDLSPWLLPGDGDRNGRLMGQPLAVYDHPNLTAANNIAGDPVWNSGSNAVLLQERLRRRPPADSTEHVLMSGLAPSRIAIARLDRRPTKPRSVASVRVGDWAPTPVAYTASIGSNAVLTVAGKGGGTADLSYQGNLAGGTWSSTYDRYSKDGRSFVDGSIVASRYDGIWKFVADVTVTGKNKGHMKADLELGTEEGAELPYLKGGVDTRYNGRKYPDLPQLGQCYAKNPRKSRLNVGFRGGLRGKRVLVRVVANISGDRRPVGGAKVKLGRFSAKTNKNGLAQVRRPAQLRTRIAISAGDTFRRTVRSVRLPRRSR